MDADLATLTDGELLVRIVETNRRQKAHASDRAACEAKATVRAEARRRGRPDLCGDADRITSRDDFPDRAVLEALVVPLLRLPGVATVEIREYRGGVFTPG